MRYLAEVISPTQIAVWFIADEDVVHIPDGMYMLYGQLDYPVLPKPVIFEAKLAPKDHFRMEGIDLDIQWWKEVLKMAPPFEYVCEIDFRCPTEGRESKLCAALETKQPLAVQTCELTDTIKTKIVKQFEPIKYCFWTVHYVSKELLIGTI